MPNRSLGRKRSHRSSSRRRHRSISRRRRRGGASDAMNDNTIQSTTKVQVIPSGQNLYNVTTWRDPSRIEQMQKGISQLSSSASQGFRQGLNRASQLGNTMYSNLPFRASNRSRVMPVNTPSQQEIEMSALPDSDPDSGTGPGPGPGQNAGSRRYRTVRRTRRTRRTRRSKRSKSRRHKSRRQKRRR